MTKEQLFEQEPVDVSTKYGIAMLATAALIVVIRVSTTAELASELAVAALIAGGINHIQPYGPRVVQLQHD